MNRMKALRSAFLTLAVGLAAAAPAEAQQSEGLWSSVQKAGVLRCGAAVAPPYVMRDPATGQYSGYFAELCKQFADVLKVKPQFVDTTWDSIVAGLQANKWDLSLALNRTPARALAVTFSTAAAESDISLVYNKGNAKVGTPTSIADIDKPGITIAVMSGTAQDKAVSAAVKNATVVRLPSSDETRLALISKRADMVVDESDSNDMFAQQNADWSATLSPAPALAKQGVAFGLRRDVSPADLEVINIFVEDKVVTGAVDRLIKDAIAQELQASK